MVMNRMRKFLNLLCSWQHVDLKAMEASCNLPTAPGSQDPLPKADAFTQTEQGGTYHISRHIQDSPEPYDNRL